MTSFTVGDPLPKSIGRCADELAEVRAVRIEMQKETDAVKARESELRDHIINNLSKSDDTGAAGLRYRAQIRPKTLPKVNDWGVLHSWIRKNDRFDMLQKRVSDKAVMDFLEAEGRMPPGTEKFNVVDVSITKLK